ETLSCLVFASFCPVLRNLTLDPVTFPSLMGFLALIFYTVTLMPTMMKVNFPQTQKMSVVQKLLKHRRSIGLISFFLSAIHGYPYLNQRDLDLLDLETPWVYIQGVVCFLILILMTITSNTWSMKLLKKNWKKLHQLTYLVIFVLIWHVWDKMSGHWTYITPISLAILTGTAILFMSRMRIEEQNQQQEAQKKEAVAITTSSSK
ncbi:ferric reductase-like transmembrane domain-containing protein, partial [Phormidesmis sp. 146-12]